MDAYYLVKENYENTTECELVYDILKMATEMKKISGYQYWE